MLSPDVVRECVKRIRAWDKKLGLYNVILKKTTQARIKACNDVRNAVSFCAMNYLKETVVPPELNFNVDFSQYNPTTADGTKTTAKVCGSTKGHALKGGPTPGQQLTAYFIKWYALISSSGIADDPLFVVGDDHMNPEDIDVHVVPGLSLSTHVGGRGTVVFCHSRLCNQKFFHWWFLKKIIPFVRQVKEQFHYYAPTTPSWLTLDGEYCQILPLLSQEIRDALIAECIIYGDPAGSTTEITQPCDTSKLFVRPKSKKNCVTFHTHGYESGRSNASTTAKCFETTRHNSQVEICCPSFNNVLYTNLPQLCQQSEKLSDAMLLKRLLLNVAFIRIVSTLFWLTVPHRFRRTRSRISYVSYQIRPKYC